ncbi:unnamed protein product, partial [Symbiodinium necroappetens]
GDSIVVESVPGLGRVAVLIADEVWNPELSRCIALQAAEVVLHPADWDRVEAAEMAATERATENRFHLVSVHRLDSPGRVGSQTTLAGEYIGGEPIPLIRHGQGIWCRFGVEELIVVDLLRWQPHCKMMGDHLDVLRKCSGSSAGNAVVDEADDAEGGDSPMDPEGDRGILWDRPQNRGMQSILDSAEPPPDFHLGRLSWVLPSSRFPLRWRQLLFVFSGESFYHLVSNLMPIQPEANVNFKEMEYIGLDQLTPELVVLENLTTLSGLELRVANCTWIMSSLTYAVHTALGPGEAAESDALQGNGGYLCSGIVHPSWVGILIACTPSLCVFEFMVTMPRFIMINVMFSGIRCLIVQPGRLLVSLLSSILLFLTRSLFSPPAILVTTVPTANPILGAAFICISLAAITSPVPLLLLARDLWNTTSNLRVVRSFRRAVGNKVLSRALERLPFASRSKGVPRGSRDPKQKDYKGAERAATSFAPPCFVCLDKPS